MVVIGCGNCDNAFMYKNKNSFNKNCKFVVVNGKDLCPVCLNEYNKKVSDENIKRLKDGKTI